MSETACRGRPKLRLEVDPVLDEMTATTTQHAHETPEQLQRLAYQLHHVDKLPWAAVAEELDEPMAVVKDLAQDYIDRTDADARDAQAPLF